MREWKTVAFVARAVAGEESCTQMAEARENGEYKALVLSSVDELRFIRDYDGVVIFLDCGEDDLSIIDRVPTLGVPLEKILYGVCGTVYGKVLHRLHDVGLHPPPIIPCVCGIMETFNGVVDQFLEIGIITEPHHNHWVDSLAR